MPQRARFPGDVLAHPVALLAIAAVVINDRYLKVSHPGTLSGKFSDFAGLIYFPLLVFAMVEMVRWVLGATAGWSRRG